MLFGVRKLTQSAMRLFFVHKSNMYLLSSVWFQWRQHLVVRPEHWPPIEQSLHLLIKFFVLFIIRYQNIGSTSHSSRFVGHLFFFDYLPIGFTMQRCVRSFSSPKREEPLVRPRNDDVWELTEGGNSILYSWRASAPLPRSDWWCGVGNLLQPKSDMPQENVNFLSQDKK